MGHQDMFLSLMKDIMDAKQDIPMGAKVEESRDRLLDTCKKFNEKVEEGELFIESKQADQGFEFVPFCCSGGENAKFDFVWVGMNPGIAGGRWPQKFYWDKTTWQDMADFYVPKGDIRRQANQTDSTNVYQWLAEGGVWSDFYRLMIRVHMALLGKKTLYGTWEDLRTAHQDKDEEVEKAFLEQLNSHPTLNAELLPFKSHKMKLDAEEMLSYTPYCTYLNNLLKFIDDNAESDAWIFFFSTTQEVKKLLEKQTAVHIKLAEDETIIGEKGKAGTKFYFQRWEKRKLILSPFLQPYHKNGHDISALIGEIKSYFEVQ